MNPQPPTLLQQAGRLLLADAHVFCCTSEKLISSFSFQNDVKNSWA